MFCEKCGTPLENDAAFCEKCGATVVREPKIIQTSPFKFTKKMAIIALSIVAVIAIIFAIAFSGNTVKVQDFIDIEFSPAYNGYAEPTLKIDTDGLNSLMNNEKTLEYLKSLINSNKESALLVGGMVAILENNPEETLGFTEFFDISLAEDYKGLKNGDKIKVIISLNKGYADLTNESVYQVASKLGFKFSKAEFEIKVEGLEDLSAINVDFDKLLNVDFGKYEGYASPSVEINYDYFTSLLIDEVVDDFIQNNTNSTVRELLKRDCSQWFTAEFDKAYSGLKNGDIIKINIVLDDEFTDNDISVTAFEAGLALNLNGGTKTYTVTGLVVPENVLDIFEGIEQYIQYTGANGNGSLNYQPIIIPDDFSRQIGDIYLSKGTWSYSVKIVHKNTKIGEVAYYIDGETKKLSCGDILQIKASDCPTEKLEELGYIVPTTIKNTTVPDLGEYLKAQDQLTPEVITAIKANICEKREIESIDKLYFGTYKLGVECSHTSTSFIATVYYKKNWLFGGYYLDSLYDIIIKPDGTIIIEDYNVGTYYDTVEKAADKLLSSKDYTCTELN